MLAQLLEYLGDARIGLLGFGREGRSSYAFLRQQFPARKLLIADQAPIALEDPNAVLFCGPGYLEILRQCDVLLKSPGIPLKDIALPVGLEITCQTDLFLRFAPGMHAGVTGSKGKTTTSTLLYEMLRESGRKARLIGNVGVPVLDCFDEAADEISVIELSSHQLEFTRASPHVAVWTNLYPEHLDHYTGGFAGYAAAKAHICEYQSPSDVLIFNKDQPELAGFLCGNALRVGVGAEETDPFLRSLDGRNAHLRGAHNRQDVYFAATAALRLGADEDAIRRAVINYQGTPHRMELVSLAGGIQWVDDCIASIPQAVLHAIDALGNVETLILGGKDRGLEYGEFVTELIKRRLRNIICLPETGHSTARLLREAGSRGNIVTVESMEEAVEAAFGCTAAGNACLLSPAAASYNRYRSFEEKGRHFAACVNNSAAARQLSPK